MMGVVATCVGLVVTGNKGFHCSGPNISTQVSHFATQATEVMPLLRAQATTKHSPTYNNYSTGAVACSPYLVHPGPPGAMPIIHVFYPPYYSY